MKKRRLAKPIEWCGVRVSESKRERENGRQGQGDWRGSGQASAFGLSKEVGGAASAIRGHAAADGRTSNQSYARQLQNHVAHAYPHPLILTLSLHLWVCFLPLCARTRFLAFHCCNSLKLATLFCAIYGFINKYRQHHLQSKLCPIFHTFDVAKFETEYSICYLFIYKLCFGLECGEKLCGPSPRQVFVVTRSISCT